VVPGDKLGLTGVAYAVKKDVANISKYIALLLEHAKSPDGFRAPTNLLLMYAVMGENDKAFEMINKSIENKSSLLLFIFADPLLDSIKDDPKYSEAHKILYGTR